MAVFLATSGGLWLYYRNEKQKILAKSKINILLIYLFFIFLGNLEKAGTVGTPMIGGPFTLIDTEGRPLSDKDLLGKYYLLYFGFTNCPDICPEELGKIAEITKKVKKERGDDVNFVPVFITCDPERDTPEVIKSYLKGKLKEISKDKNLFLDFGDFIGLTGPSDVVKSVAKSFRIYYRPTATSSNGDYLVDHSIFFYLMGPDGKFICNFGRESSAQICAETIINEMKKRSE